MGSIPEFSILKGDRQTLPTGPDYLLHRLFERSAAANICKPALFSETDAASPTHTFAQLDALSSRLARVLLNQLHRLKAEPNADGDFIVGVSLSPGAPLVATLLAVWKMGAAYMPVEPSVPIQRAAHILADSKPLFVVGETRALTEYANVLLYQDLLNLSQEQVANAIPDTECVPCATNKEPLAAVLYTSGSTGAPKGVRLSHRAVLNRLQWQWRVFPFAEDEQSCVFKTALSFVDSVGEMFAPLLQGRALVTVPRCTVGNPEKLAEVLALHQVRRLVLVPSLLRALLLVARERPKLLNGLRLWVCSGEELHLELARDFFSAFPSGSHLANFYGSTEVMGDVTYFLFRDPNDVEWVKQSEARVPIGIPVENTIIYLLDKQFRPVLAGEQGEVFVAGLNVANGYVNNRDPTKFVPNPFATDHAVYSTLYHTGDFGRIVKGNLVYEGRADSQIKVRGHRVDLSEIQKAVQAVPGLDKVIVLCYQPGRPEQAVLAFVTMAAGSCMSTQQIEASLQRSLASYMMPQIIILENFPLLVNGKIDRQLLLRNYEQKQEENGSINVLLDLSSCPEHHKEAAQALLETVKSVLGGSLKTNVLTLDANFYQMGGNSLNSVFTVTKLRDQGFNIGISDFIAAANLGEVVEKMGPRKVALDVEMDKENRFPQYTAHMLTPEHKDSVFRMIVESFYQKADIEKWLRPQLQRSDYEMLIQAIWKPVVEKNLSFLVKDKDGRDVGAALNFDVYDEPDVDIDSRLMIVFEFLESVEVQVREKVLPKGKGKVVHSFMMGTEPALSAAENVDVIAFMEEEVLRLARRRSFKGIFTTNTSPLTQQLGSDIFGYEPLLEYQVNKFVAADGSMPFKEAPDWQMAVSCWKKV
ncbi:beta-alanyl-bioamine nonribosomal peptide synthetase ebony [Neocloeon triangulifer]|uniref:beta-alanyl-bioamine nonribosomal peptide synthetase ebony n=1 Tax=Neocloeon triangulifer TaxID=2078957 RepID=UPI00286F0EDB|nr:beta-alanyl-bioamine nonribosomal peptide synthetase ebony [Neocloeon triangulifer]